MLENLGDMASISPFLGDTTQATMYRIRTLEALPETSGRKKAERRTMRTNFEGDKYIPILNLTSARRLFLCFHEIAAGPFSKDASMHLSGE